MPVATRRFLPLLACTALAAAFPALAQISPANNLGITSPAQAFRQEPGSDYFLADHTTYEAYLRKLATQSDRMKLVEFGKSSNGRPMLMAIVSSPANLANLDRYRDIAEKMARAKISSDEARKLAAEGKAVVWIDAGLHATETVTTQSQIHVLYRMLTAQDAETKRLLDDVIILFAHDNPDGLQMVADWYMRNADPKKREFRTLPDLYQKYVGHDNNRDSFMANMTETENINRQLFRVWYPQIIFNQHQTGPAGMVVFVPPFRDPFNHNYDPLVMTTLSEVGNSMHSRLIGEGKPGSGMRSVAPYSTWHNGMERSIAYFHNSIGLLTEIIGGPTPEKIPLIPDNQIARGDEPMPVSPRDWHLKDSLEYQWSLDRAVIDYASRNRERLLMNIYTMGANSIARGSTDTWTIRPNDIDALKEAGAKSSTPVNDPGGRARAAIPAELFDKVLRDPAKRDPRGYVLTVDQADFPTAVAFMNTLIKNGVDVERATSQFTVGGKTYPAGSFVVRTAQAYRPHIIDMFEPQDHPHDPEYPGGPPKLPYDVAGYTLAYQMGVKFDRVQEGFDGPFQKVADVMAPPPGAIVGNGRAGWLLSHETNNGFILSNRLLKAGVPVAWSKAAVTAGGAHLGAGAIWVPASAKAAEIVAAGVKELGINAYAVDNAPQGETISLKKVRIGLVDQYGGLMPAGWTKWLLEKFEFDYQPVFPPELDAGNLNRKFDVLLFTGGSVPAQPGDIFPGRTPRLPDPSEVPAEYRGRIGLVTADRTIPQLKAFANAGGTIVTVGNGGQLATMVGAPVTPALVQNRDGKLTGLDSKNFFIPGSVLEASFDPSQPLGYGMPAKAKIFFDDNQTWRLNGPDAARIAWFDDAKPLRSGWAIGQEKLNGTVAVADVTMGRGKLLVLAPEVTQRGQPYGTFKLLFNGLLYGPAVSGK